MSLQVSPRDRPGRYQGALASSRSFIFNNVPYMYQIMHCDK